VVILTGVGETKDDLEKMFSVLPCYVFSYDIYISDNRALIEMLRR
jgi:hypothetical protein